MKRMTALFVIAAFLSSCAHTPKPEFETALQDGHCDEALQHLNVDDQTKLLGRTERTVGTTLSYAVTGAGYGADVVLSIVGGTVMYIGLCSPMILASIASGGRSGGTPASADGSTQYACLPADVRGITFPHNGRNIYRATTDWRCPDLTAFARGIRKVALCHEAKGGREGLAKASQAIHSLTANNDFMECISETENDAIRSEAYRLDSLLHKDDPP